jgi:BirA family biotin operon repressor/biotin-[acetyl-CoA-carboxylase] ligase
MCSALDIEWLRQNLHTAFIGQGERLHYVPILDSTNTLAMKRIKEAHVGEGFVVLTDSQTAGRGRLGRHWVDSFGYNVLSSTVLTPRFPLSLLVMLASLAVVDTIGEVSNITATIKWPNDVLIEERKVAGILIETVHTSQKVLTAIMGIGINVYSYPLPAEVAQDLAKKAITLEDACGHRISREALIAHLLHAIEASYISLQNDVTTGLDMDVNTVWGPAALSLRARWRNHLSTLGRAVEVRQGDTLVSGIAEDVDDTGELLLRRHSGERVRITWGDIGYPTAETTR